MVNASQEDDSRAVGKKPSTCHTLYCKRTDEKQGQICVKPSSHGLVALVCM